MSRVLEASEIKVREHSAALVWKSRIQFPAEVVWLLSGWASGEGEEFCPALISAGGLRRIRRLGRSEHAGLQARARHILDERVAMQAAVRTVLSESVAFSDSSPASELFVWYTRLGQPRVGWRGQAAAWAKNRGIRLSDLHISFTHDGEAVIALAAHTPGLRGVGVDVVRLDRFRGRGREYLQRFARHFMSESEYAAFITESAGEVDEEIIGRVAAHFSLMESASKALGTGLKIGGGMGKPESMSKRSINIAGLEPVRWQLESEVESRMSALGATRMEGHWSADSEYLVSAAFLMG